MTKSFWVLLWISIHTLLHLFQTWPLLTSRVWAKGQQQNSQQNMWLPEPRMGNLAQASSHTKFHQLYRLISQHQHFNLSSLTKRKMLRKFSVWTKRWSTSGPFWDCRFSIHLQMKAQLASQGWAGASPHQCQAPPQHSTQACEARELQEAQAAHRLNTISSQGSKMIIDFILIGLSAMSQFKC